MADYAVDLVRCASEMIPYLETQLEWGLGGGWRMVGGGWWVVEGWTEATPRECASCCLYVRKINSFFTARNKLIL